MKDHKHIRKGTTQRIDDYHIAWESWTECEKCGRFDFRKGLEVVPKQEGKKYTQEELDKSSPSRQSDI